jgi:hypothetical protein
MPKITTKIDYIDKMGVNLFSKKSQYEYIKNFNFKDGLPRVIDFLSVLQNIKEQNGKKEVLSPLLVKEGIIYT